MNFSIFTVEKILCILHGHVFVMKSKEAMYESSLENDIHEFQTNYMYEHQNWDMKQMT